MIRTVLQHGIKSRNCSTMLNVINVNSHHSLQMKQISYLLGLPLKHFALENYNFQFVSSILNYIIKSQFYLKYSHTVKKYEVENLCESIWSSNVESWESKKIEDVKNIVSFLLSSGYSSKQIKEKFSTHITSSDCSYAKIKLLADLHSDISLLLPLLQLSLTRLKSISNTVKTDDTNGYSNRIAFLSYHLKLEPSQVIPLLVKHPALLNMKFDRLNTKMTILKNANISPKYIVKDLWIFNYNEQLLANRIKAAATAGVELKPWILRCSKSIFESILFKYHEKNRILDGETVDSYLAEKLDCSIEYVSYMMERNKMLKNINIPKLEQIINFLFKKGYTAEEIRLFPRVFCSSVVTLDKKFEEFQQTRSTLPTLAQLCMSTAKKNLTLSRQK